MLNFEFFGFEFVKKYFFYIFEVYFKCGLIKDVYIKEGDFWFNYLYILIYINNINLSWRDNVFDYVNRNI